MRDASSLFVTVSRPTLRLSLLTDLLQPVHSCPNYLGQKVCPHRGQYKTGGPIDAGNEMTNN